MQAKSKSKLIFDRIQALRLKQGWTWEQTASELGVGKVMIHLVKKGKRGLSDKVLYRLVQAETKAGIRATERRACGMVHEGNEADYVYNWMVELRKRWNRNPRDRDTIRHLVAALFADDANDVLAWFRVRARSKSG